MIRNAVDEVQSPKYSHVERERRWLVDSDDIPEIPAEFVRITDRYIIGTRMRLRRMESSATGKVALKLTKKYDTCDSRFRPIVTAYLDEQEFSLLAELPANEIMKRRYKVGELEPKYVLDVFEGKLDGLLIAEIECDSEKELVAVASPQWSKREITNNERFQGGELSKIGETELKNLLRS